MFKIKATHILHGLFLTLFLLSVYRSFQGFLDCYYSTNTKEYDLNAAIFSITHCHGYWASLFLLIPMIGILIKNKSGWIFIAAFIYFIQINYVAQDNMDNILFLSIVTIILLMILLLINTKSSILTYYKISTKNNITINTIALFLGACLSYLLIVLRHY